MKRKCKGFFLFLLHVVIFWYLIQYILKNAVIMQKIEDAPLWMVVVGIVSMCCSLVLTGLLDVTCANGYDITIGKWGAIGMTFIASAINLIVPMQLGSVIKAAYFKKMYRLEYIDYVAIVSGTIIMNFIITIVQIIICFLIMSFNGKGYYNYIVISMLCLIIFAGCFYFFLKYKNYILYKISLWNSKMYSISKSFYILFEKKETVFLLVGNLLLHVIFGIIRFACLFMILGLKNPWICGGLYYGLYIASTIVPVLPGNIGISEFLVGIANSLLGSAFDVGITAVLIERIYYYLISFVGAILFGYPIWRLWETKMNDK